METKYIFVIGGVMSSVGKGITTASIGKILQSKGYKVCLIKCDMYINIDAGTIRPTEHGEVFVGEDGIEADQDLGNYERFTGIASTRDNYITTGQIYKTVIERERNLEYDGEDVEVVPDIPNEIIRRIKEASAKKKTQITIIEIGGTVGEYQNLLFLEAARMMHLQMPNNVIFILVSYLPIPKKVGEMKTKPTQYAARSLNSAGIQADFILARAETKLDEKRKNKLSVFCNVPKDFVISAPDVDSIYEVPINFEKENLGNKILKKFNLEQKKNNLDDWKQLITKSKNVKKQVEIAIVGKYFATGDFVLSDSYISVIEAIKHASFQNNIKPNLTWINSQEFEDDIDSIKNLNNYDAIIVPGGFGSRGTEGIISAIKYARQNNIPFLGLCYGMQLATIEFARNVAGFKDANSTEIDPNTKYPVIDLMQKQRKILKKNNYGATMRLGNYPCTLINSTLARKLYNKENILERHRHRYEFNNNYLDLFKQKGLIISGINKIQNLVEIIEIKQNNFFVATQFHPEFNSRPLHPHPLFFGLIEAAINKPANC
ncbi:MAG: CTP synthetase [Candidatus Aenigmarchaeota archaeon ex4484_52]|nr:MAG: CTP synthetase [Candidatus Aenigmarchaeota archaeon ex4484_52]